MPGPLSGLSVKIIATIIVVILAVEVVIYLPSAANFRQSWLSDRLRVGIVAARVLDAVPDAMDLPRMLTDRLLTSAGALAIVYRREGQSQLIELEGAETPREAVTVDMRLRDALRALRGDDGTFMPPREGEILAFPRPGAADDAAYAAEASVLVEIEGIVRAEQRVRALEARLDALARAPLGSSAPSGE